MPRQRTKNEVFTPDWIAKRMIHQDKKYVNDIFLESSAGNGNFLVAILKEKLHKIIKTVPLEYKLFRAGLISLSQIYGIELFKDNVNVAKQRMLKVLVSIINNYVATVSLSLTPNNTLKVIPNFNITSSQEIDYLQNDWIKYAKSIINSNIIQGNSLTNKNTKKQPLKLFIWGYNNSQEKPVKSNCRLFLGANTPNPNMIPDFIIGNPPYDIKNHTKNNISYSQVFNYFVANAIKIAPKYVSLIIPNRWFSGGKNLKHFREKMLTDKHIKSINIWANSKDVFPNVAINGGVSYFLWNRSYNNSHQGIRVSHYLGKHRLDSAIRPLKINNTNIFISDNVGASIVNKLVPYLKSDNLGKHCSSSCPFTLRPYYPKRSSNWLTHPVKNSLKCYARNGHVGYIKRNILKKRLATHKSKQKYEFLIPRYKLITPCANGIGISKNNNIKTIIAEPYSICTETYIVIGYDLNFNKDELENLSKYLKTPLVRFLISLHKSSQHAVRKVYNFVPLVGGSNNNIIDFFNTKKSVINWNGSIIDCNHQLIYYFGLSPNKERYIDRNF